MINLRNIDGLQVCEFHVLTSAIPLGSRQALGEFAPRHLPLPNESSRDARLVISQAVLISARAVVAAGERFRNRPLQVRK